MSKTLYGLVFKETHDACPETYNVYATPAIHVPGETQRIRPECSVDSEASSPATASAATA